MYERALAGVSSIEEFRRAPIDISAELDALVPPAERATWMALPGDVEVRGKPVPIDYDVEETDGVSVGVARLRLPEKLARTLAAEELPRLDRPMRFIVTRGPRGAVRAATLDELQDLLDRPWTDAELDRLTRERDERRERKQVERRDKRMNNASREMRRDRSQKGGEVSESGSGSRGGGGRRQRGPRGRPGREGGGGGRGKGRGRRG
jgi:ATP-dependent helicase HrpA